MSLETLKREAAALDDSNRRKFFTFLVSMREQQWTAQVRSLARNLDDPNPNHWLSLKDFEFQLADIPEPPER